MDAQMTWENSCRLCSEERVEMLPIFGEEGLQRRVPEKLRVCLPVMVYKTDPLPKQICQFCAARLDDVFEFREYCLNVYKNVHLKLMTSLNTNSVKIFLDAMFNSSDPCQVQLCTIKQRAPPPLVPLPSSLSLNDLIPSPVTIPKAERLDVNFEPLAELPCEVQIKEEPSHSTTDPNLFLDQNNEDQSLVHENFRENDGPGDDDCDAQSKNNEQQTSILEQVLTGSLAINDSQELVPKTKLSSEWWCPPCNDYYQTKENLVEHMQLYCPRKYACGKCSVVFKTLNELTEHEAENHSKMNLGSDESLKECHQCNREFVSWEMLQHHRLRHHFADSIEFAANTWCSLCNRFLPNEELYRNHQQLHENDKLSDIPAKYMTNRKMKKEGENLKAIRRGTGAESIKSLTCPTCGKVCSQQSALSNHMRTHEPKKYKCDICGRSFGLFIRLAAHKLNEHDVQQSVSLARTNVEQEEALNAEREAREAHKKRLNKKTRCRTLSEVLDDNDWNGDERQSPKRSAVVDINAPRNVARCGICQEWFHDHTTMLTHLQKHSDKALSKDCACSICGRIFEEKWQLQRHEVSHKRAEASIHKCSVCNESFPDEEQLDAHREIHVVDKTYHCSKCNKIFFKESSMMAHQCTSIPLSAKRISVDKKIDQRKSSPNSNNKQFKCPKCPEVFGTAKLRNLHARIHGEGKFTSDMDLVKNGDGSMAKLKHHTLSSASIPVSEPNVGNTGDQYVIVPLKRTLIRTASGYRCGVCQSPFVLRDLAVAHLRSAHPVMPYQCPYCKKRFTAQYTFTHHIKTDHPDESEK